MDLVRTAINEIRAGWDRYAVFASDLQRLLFDTSPPELDLPTAQRVERLLAARRSWEDRSSSTRDGYEAIRLYTSQAGYDLIFRAINAAFRSDRLGAEPDTLRAATFLVELLNVDLFHYRAAHTDADGYTGVVYRGMTLAPAELELFEESSRGPIAERYVSVPLAMVSSSTDRNVAMRFALEEAARDTGRQPLLWEIQVLEMDKTLMGIYRDSFPDTVVTSLCAVPIWKLSEFPGENEVLLRGPHFQILDVSDCDLADFGRPVKRLRVVMHNTNRDHITAIASNTDADKDERDLFRALVLCDRFRACAWLARESGRDEDGARYEALAQIQEGRIAGREGLK
jgi:hypothetical protein